MDSLNLTPHEEPPQETPVPLTEETLPLQEEQAPVNAEQPISETPPSIPVSRKYKKEKSKTKEPSLHIEKEVHRVLSELLASGLSMKALIVLVADEVELPRQGYKQVSWRRKKEIVREVLATIQQITKELSIKEK